MRNFGQSINKNSIISVIIPTYQSMDYLPFALESIVYHNKLLLDGIEIIVVDTTPLNCSAQIQTRKLCEAYSAKYFNCSWRSVAASRNFGASKAEGKYLFFLDSDCRVVSHTIQNHLATLNSMKFNYAGSVGYTKLEEPLSIAGRAMKITPFTIAFKWATFLHDVPWGPTCNLLIKKKIFHEVNGFDDQFFSIVGGEDVDFGWRIVDRGFKWIACPKGIVIHNNIPWNSWKSNFIRSYRYGIGDHYLVYKHFSRKFLDPLRYLPTLFLILIIAFITSFIYNITDGVCFAICSFLSIWITHGIRLYLRRNREYNLLTCILSELYIMAFDYGHFISAIRQRKIIDIFKRVSYGRQQIVDCRIRLIINILAILFILIITASIAVGSGLIF